MKEKLINGLKYTFFFAVGIALMIYLFQDLEIDKVMVEARKMNYIYFVYSAVFALIAHYSRASRWKILINSVGYNPQMKNVFGSVLIMNLLNIAIPRSGEVARCGTLYKYEKIPVKKLLGTVFVERLFDLFSLLFLTLLLIVLKFDIVQDLYFKSSMPEKVQSIANNGMMLLSLVLLFLIFCIILYILRQKLQKISLFQKLIKLVYDAKEGILKMWSTDKKWMFLFNTVVIWIMYYLMIYICFYAYEPTADLGPSVGYTMFIAGSYGMVAPTNGGVGAWHAMCMLALSVFEISDLKSGSFVNVVFVVVTATVIITGAITMMILPILNRKSK